MKDKFESLFASKIFRIFYTTGFSTGIRIISAIILSKIIAIKLGPPGLALLGQLTNFVTIALLLSSGGFGNGVIKYIAELKSSEQELKTFIKQSFKLTVLIALFIGILTIAFASNLSSFCFETKGFNYVFWCLGSSIVFYATNNYVISLLNGWGDYRAFNVINIANSVVSLVLSVALIYYLGLKGAFLAIAFNQSLSCLITFLFTGKYIHLFKSFWAEKISRPWLSKLLSFSIMSLVTAMLVPTSQIIVRRILLSKFGGNGAGEWEAINRISGLYLSLILNIMLVYYLPKLSALKGKNEVTREIRNGFYFFVPILISICAVVYFSKQIIIELFLSTAFIGIKFFFLPQLIGDFFKILAFIYAYLVIAKAHTKYYVFTEILFATIYLIFSFLFVNFFGNIGPVYAYMITYILYFIFQISFTLKVVLNEHPNSS